MKSLMSVSALALVIAVAACSKPVDKAGEPASAPASAEPVQAAPGEAAQAGPARPAEGQGGQDGGRDGGSGGGWGGGGGGMARFDANKDGKVSQAEFVTARHGMLDRMDEDGDAKVSRQELEATGRERMVERVMKLDLNGDGSVDQAEFDKGTAQQFRRMDKNADGVLDGAEMIAMRERFRDRRGGNGGDGD